ncbi:tetraspanin-31-like isoform X2 [Apostichopus japonicus]|uniref:tetraspanin-31-like isoform X2 n=1 Tax=Stichopus japonicus TaxID=307972 RepID=UPI003AB422E3
MGCGSFQCSRNALIALNSLFILISLLLIILPAVAKAQALVDSMSTVGGIIACGVFLFLVSLLGLIGAIRHHQVCLFFYMVILFLIFLLEFVVSIFCLAVSENQLRNIVESTWNSNSTDSLQKQIQNQYCCCKLNAKDNTTSCGDVKCADSATNPEDEFCEDAAVEYAKYYLNWTGALGLFFSLIELIGVWLAVRYRNQKDPRANPSAFL